jgi:ABC-type amino acid transport substrate-binding protein
MKILKIICCILAVIMIMSVFTACGESNKSTYIILDEDFGDEEYAIGFRRDDNALTLKVQSLLDEMIADGKAGEISTQWFGSDQVLKNVNFPREIADTGDASLDNILSKGKFIVGLDVGFKPMGFYDDAGNIVGFDIDLAKEIGVRLGVEVVFQPIDWASKEMELNGGKIDAIWNGMSVLPARVEEMNVSKPYLANRMIIIVKDGSGLKAKADLEGKNVGVQKGSSALDAINADEIHSKFAIVNYEDNPSAFLDLQSGRIDALVVDEVVGRNLIAESK